MLDTKVDFCYCLAKIFLISKKGFLPSERLKMGKKNYLKEALKEKLNLLGIVGIAVASVAVNPLILAVGVAAELLYLALTPNLVGYKRLVNSRYDKKEQERLKHEKRKLLTSLSTDQQLRYKRLERMRDKLLNSKKDIGEENFSLFENSITGNYSQSRGGAILIKSSRAEVSQNNLSDNHSKTGGAIYVDNSAVKILRNIISRNTSYDEFPSGRGGAIVCNRTDNAEISGNIVASNSSSTDGGGIYALDCEHLVLTNNTISDNRAADNGGGIYLDNSSAAIVNSIIYGNTAETGGEMFTMECSVFFAYSDVFFENILSDNRSSFTYGDGTIDADPGFSEIADTRYELAPFSTCIDAGVGSIYIESWDTTIDMLAYDVYGNERPQLANWDIGAVEYVGFGILSSVENHKPFSNEISVLTYPNPFNSKLEIKTSIPSGENIRVSVYDMFGRKIGTIYDGTTTSDNQTFIWNAENEISGTYLLRVQHNSQVSDAKVRLIK